MTIHIIIGVVALACGSVCGIVGTFTGLEMMDRVNDKLPENEKFDPLVWAFESTASQVRVGMMPGTDR
jgi:hypothetical protein